MTPTEFAQLIKSKYPSYKDVDDLELAKRVVAKYPSYAKNVVFEPVETVIPKTRTTDAIGGDNEYKINTPPVSLTPKVNLFEEAKTYAPDVFKSEVQPSIGARTFLNEGNITPTKKSFKQFAIEKAQEPIIPISKLFNENDKALVMSTPPLAQIIYGGGKGLTELAEGMTTPANLGLIVLGMAKVPAIVHRIASGGFGAMMLKEVPELVNQYKEAYKQGDTIETARIGTQIAGSGVFGLLGLKGAIPKGSAVGKLMNPPEKVNLQPKEIIPPVVEQAKPVETVEPTTIENVKPAMQPISQTPVEIVNQVPLVDLTAKPIKPKPYEVREIPPEVEAQSETVFPSLYKDKFNQEAMLNNLNKLQSESPAYYDKWIGSTARQVEYMKSLEKRQNMLEGRESGGIEIPDEKFYGWYNERKNVIAKNHGKDAMLDWDNNFDNVVSEYNSIIPKQRIAGLQKGEIQNPILKEVKKIAKDVVDSKETTIQKRDTNTYYSYIDDIVKGNYKIYIDPKIKGEVDGIFEGTSGKRQVSKMTVKTSNDGVDMWKAMQEWTEFHPEHEGISEVDFLTTLKERWDYLRNDKLNIKEDVKVEASLIRQQEIGRLKAIVPEAKKGDKVKVFGDEFTVKSVTPTKIDLVDGNKMRYLKDFDDVQFFNKNAAFPDRTPKGITAKPVERQGVTPGVPLAQKQLPIDTDSPVLRKFQELWGGRHKDMQQVEQTIMTSKNAQEATAKLNSMGIDITEEKAIQLEPFFKGGLPNIPTNPKLTITMGENIGEPLPKYAYPNINLERLDTTNDVKMLINDISKASKDTVSKKYNANKITFKQIKDIASFQGSEQDMKNIIKGKNYNVDTSDGKQQLLVDMQVLGDLKLGFAEKINKIQQRIATTQDPIEKKVAEIELQEEFAKYMTLLETTAGRSQLAGQYLGMHKIMKKARTAFKDNPTLWAEQLQKSVMKKFGYGTKEYDAYMKKISDIATYAQPEMVEQFMRDMSEAPTGYQLWKDYFYNNILSGVKTSVTNLTNTTMNFAFNELALSPKRALDKTLIPALMAQQRAVPLALKEFGHTMKYGYSQRDLMGLTVENWEHLGEAFTRHPDAKMRTVGVWLSNPTFRRILRATDQFIFNIAEQGELASLATKKALKESTDKEVVKALTNKYLNDENIIAEAKQYAKVVTYHQKPPDWFNVINKMKRMENPVGVATTAIAPFTDIAYNLLKTGFDFSPLGFANAIRKGGTETQKYLSVVKALTGTALMAYFWDKYQKGDIIIPATDKAKQAVQYGANLEPWSIMVKGKDGKFSSISLRYVLEPFINSSMYMILAQQQIEQGIEKAKKYSTQEEKNSVYYNAALKAVQRIGNFTLDSTFLSGLKQLFAMFDVQAGEGAVSRFLVQPLSGQIPYSGLNQTIKQLVDPRIRERRTPIEAVAEKFNLSPLKLDVYGKPIERPFWGRVAAVAPIRVGEGNFKSAEYEMARIGLGIDQPDKELEFFNKEIAERIRATPQGQEIFAKRPERVILTDKEKRNFVKLFGNEFYSKMQDIVKKDVYKNATDINKRMIANKVKSAIRSWAIMELRKDVLTNRKGIEK